MIKARNFIFPTLVLGVILTMYWLAEAEKEEKSRNPSLNDMAVMPDKLLQTSKMYFDEYSVTHGIEYLERAIESMKYLEKDADEAGDHTIEESIEELEYVLSEIMNATLTEREVSHIYVRALNSLAYAQIRISESYQRKNDAEKADLSLDFAVEHMHNALRFAMGSEWDREAKLVLKLDSLVEHVSVNTSEMIIQLDMFLVDIENFLKED